MTGKKHSEFSITQVLRLVNNAYNVVIVSTNCTIWGTRCNDIYLSQEPTL